MKTENIHFLAEDGSKHFLRCWLPDGAPRAVLQIIHGMAEHSGRYHALAEALSEDGIAVYAQDLPGHGHTGAESGSLGHLADRDGWAYTLGTIAEVREHARRRHPGVPILVFGHSMGSFLAQHIATEASDELAGIVLSATTEDMGPARGPGAVLMAGLAMFLGRRYLSAIGEWMSFKEFNKAFRPNRTEFDWLSRDTAEVDAYIADPWCGHRCSLGLWHDLLKAGAGLADPQRLQRLNKDRPMLLLAGSADPVSRGEQGPRALAAAYRQHGVREVTELYYDGARHELLHETCRDQVTRDLRDWIGNLLAAGQS